MQISVQSESKIRLFQFLWLLIFWAIDDDDDDIDLAD